MDPVELKRYEAMLLELRTEIKAELEQANIEEAPVEVDGRMGRISRGDAMQVQQMALEMKRRRKEQLLRIRTALQRAEDGTYGLCGRCSQQINSERLDVQPDAVFCVQCASGARG